MVVALGFIVNRLITYGMDFSLLRSPWVVVGLFGVAVFEGIGVVGASLNYYALVRNVSGIRVMRPLAVLVYNIANLYKYIPGGVMYVVGRNRLAVETEGLSHGKVAFATVLEGLIVAVGALLVALVLSFEHSFSYIRQAALSPLIIALVIGVPTLIALLVYFFWDRLRHKFKEFFADVDIIKPGVIVKRLGVALVLMFFWGASFVAVITLLGQPMTLSLALTIVGLYLLSWLAGFLAPGAPSGFGIREAMLLMLMPGVVNDSVLLSAMLIHRFVTVLGDVIAYCFALIYERAATYRMEVKNEHV